MSPARKGGTRLPAGTVVSIEYEPGRECFAMVLEDPLVAFFDYSTERNTQTPISEIVGKPIAFKIWVMKYAITGKLWPVVGQGPVPTELQPLPWFYKKDALNGKIYRTKMGGGGDFESSLAEIEGLECAAVWDPEHVVDRLKDHFAGRANKWLEILKAKLHRLAPASGLPDLK